MVVETEDKLVAPLQIHHVGADYRGQSLNDQFPVDAQYAILEPTLRSNRDGFYIRVESPADFVRLWPSDPLVKAASFPPPKRLPDILLKSPKDLKDDGNKLFSTRRFTAASDVYTLALEKDSETSDIRSTLLSNRAACFIRMHRYNSALEDCKEALQLDLARPIKIKVLFRSATAAYALQKYGEAERYLSQLLGLSPNNSEALEFRNRLQTRLREAEYGAYDWPALFKSAKQGDRLDVADFVSNKIATQSIVGRGRGLVAVAPIEPGELLLVQRPLAMGVGDRNRKTYVAGANLFTDTLDPYALGDLVAQLAERMMEDSSVRETTLDLHAGDESQLEPKSNWGVDISRLEAIVTFNAFHTECLTSKSSLGSSKDKAGNLKTDNDVNDNMHAPSSLYGMPSMLNHACIGNVSYSFLADTIVLRAKLRLEAGTELVDSYTDSLQSLARRRETLDKHGFVCDCALCQDDRAVDQAVLSKRDRLSAEVEQLTDQMHGAGANRPKISDDEIVAHLRKIIFDMSSTYQFHTGSTSAAPTLRPAMYPAWRLLSATLASHGRVLESARNEINALEALGAVFGHTIDAPEQGDVRVGEKLEQAQLEHVPRVGDVNAVLSSLFIAQQLGLAGHTELAS